MLRPPKEAPPLPEFLTVRETAALLRLAPVSVYRMVDRQELPVYRFLRVLRFKRRDVLEYIERSRTGDAWETSRRTRPHTRKPLW